MVAEISEASAVFFLVDVLEKSSYLCCLQYQHCILTLSRLGFFGPSGQGWGGSGSPPIREYRSFMYSNETLRMYSTSEVVCFEVGIMS